MRTGYIGIAFSVLTACLGLGEVETDSVTDAGGGNGGVGDAGWPDSFADVAKQCDPGTKPCNASCVPIDDPSYGCTGSGCAPCQLPGAVQFCSNLTCALQGCLLGRLDCDQDPTNGCETEAATDPTNCGTCGTVCGTTNGTGSCVAGECEIVCDAGFANCDNANANGCESSLATSQHCGTCAKKCSTGFSCQSADCHCTTQAACDGGSFGQCIGGICFCAGGSPCTGGKKCTTEGCQ